MEDGVWGVTKLRKRKSWLFSLLAIRLSRSDYLAKSVGSSYICKVNPTRYLKWETRREQVDHIMFVLPETLIDSLIEDSQTVYVKEV